MRGKEGMGETFYLKERKDSYKIMKSADD